MPRKSKTPRPPAPDKDNPLAEPTVQRRIWAAYLHRGYNRADFAREVGLSYTIIDRWERGTDVSLPSLIKVAEVLGFTLDELCLGRSASARPPGMSEENIRRIVRDELISIANNLTGDIAKTVTNTLRQTKG